MIGLLEIRRRLGQFALIAVVVTLISYLVLMINGLGVGLNNAAGSALRNFDADAIGYSDKAGLSVIRSEIAGETIVEIGRAPGVTQAAALGYVAASYPKKSGEVKSAAFLGYDIGTLGEPRVTGGRALNTNDTRGVLADKTFLRVSGLAIGDSVQVSYRLQSETFTIEGEVDEGQFFFQPAVYLLRSSWQAMKYGAEPGAPAASIVLLKGDDLPGETGPGFAIVSKETAFANIEGVSGQQATVTSLRLFGYVIGAMVIGVFFYVLTLQKVPNIGVLKALGASSSFIFNQLLVQSVVVAAAGIAVSVPLAYLTDRALARAPESVPIAFTTGTYLTTCAALVITALVGTLFSARQVLKVDPIIALGQQQ